MRTKFKVIILILIFFAIITISIMTFNNFFENLNYSYQQMG